MKKFTQKILGIDFGDTHIKMVELCKDRKGGYFSKSAIASLPPEVIIGKSIRNIPAVSDALKSGLKEAHIKTPHAIAAIPDIFIIKREIQLSGLLTEKEIQAHLSLEADKYFNQSANDLCIDFSAAEKKWLVLAAPKTEITSRVTALKAAGLKIKIIEPESAAIIRNMPNTDIIKACVHIDSGYLSLHITHQNLPIYSTSEMFDDKGDFIGNLILQQLEWYKTENSQLAPQEIVLTGDHPDFSHLLFFLKRQTKLLVSAAPIFMLATGLALREFNQ
jgi:Tfp pilus assembly PilM family ATPase